MGNSTLSYVTYTTIKQQLHAPSICKSSHCRHGCFNEGCNERSGCLASLRDVAGAFMAPHYNVQFASANYNAPYHYPAPRPDHKLELQLQTSMWE